VTFETSRLRPGEIVSAVGAILLFVFMFFFKWYGVSLPGGQDQLAKAIGFDTSALAVDGWHGHTVLRWLMLLTIIAALALAFLTATQRTVALPVTMAVIVSALAALLTVLLAYRVIIDQPGPNQYIDVKLGAWLGLLSSAVIAYGGYLSMRDEGTSLSDAKEQARAAGQQARAAFEGAAPRSQESASTAPPGAAPPPRAPSASPTMPPPPPPSESPAAPAPPPPPSEPAAAPAPPPSESPAAPAPPPPPSEPAAAPAPPPPPSEPPAAAAPSGPPSGAPESPPSTPPPSEPPPATS
jgi:hypothetical protein